MLAHSYLGHTEVGQRVGVVGADTQRGRETALGLDKPFQREQGRAVVAVIDGNAWIQLNGAADKGQCFLVPALLLAYDAQEMQCAGVVRLRGKDLPICLLGLLTPAVLMKHECCFERSHENPPADADLHSRSLVKRDHRLRSSLAAGHFTIRKPSPQFS